MTQGFYRTTMSRQSILFAVLFALMFAGPLQAADLAITIHGLRSDAGQLRLAIFDKAKEFPRGEKIHNRDIAAKAGDIIVVFRNIAPGTYALAIHHDENINKSMDTNFFGLPQEGYGFSNNARVLFGPPTFEAASFNVGSENATISLRVVY
jgi:uncharacterized protein (DUF2141 family)